MAVGSGSFRPGATPSLLRRDVLALTLELLESGKSVRITATGGSMRPFLNGGEILTIEPTSPSSLRMGDLVLIRSPVGAVLIHRIVRQWQRNEVRWLQTKGDGLYNPDQAVPAHRVAGKVVRVERPADIGDTTAKSTDLSAFSERVLSRFAALTSLGYYFLRRALQSIKYVLPPRLEAVEESKGNMAEKRRAA